MDKCTCLICANTQQLSWGPMLGHKKSPGEFFKMCPCRAQMSVYKYSCQFYSQSQKNYEQPKFQSTGGRKIDTQIIVYPYIGALSYRIKLLFCSMTSKLLPRERRWTDRSWLPSKVRKENASLCLAGKLRSSDQLSNSPRSQHHAGRKLKYPKWRSRGGRTNQPDSTSYRYLVV